MPKFSPAVSVRRIPEQALALGLCMLCLGWQLAGIALPATAQDEPTIIISPESGEVAAALLSIDIAGLEASRTYTVEFIFEGEVVFSSDETSDENGHISYPAASTEDDLPGTYMVQVVLDGEVVVSAEFELTATEESLPGSVSVVPEAGPIGTVHTLTIEELGAQTEYTVEITAKDSQQVGYRRRHSSDDEGSIELEIFAEEGDTPGQQAIAVYDEDGELVAAGQFTIEAPPQRQVAVEVNPLSAEAGSLFDIHISGLAAFDRVSAEVKGADDVVIDSLTARASSDGDAELAFDAPDDLAVGSYSVVIGVEGDEAELASTSLEIVSEAVDAPIDDEADSDDAGRITQPAEDESEGAASRGEASVTIEPQAGIIGTTHLISVRNLDTDEAVTFDVTYEGRTVFSTEKVADEDGAIQLELFTTAGDKAGDYLITVLRDSGNQPSVTLTATTEPVPDLAPSPLNGGAQIIRRSLVDGSAMVIISAEADQYLLFTVAADGFDPAAILYDPYGFALAANDDGRGGLAASIGPLRLPESGDYALEVYPSVGVPTHRIADDRFTVTLQTVSVAPIIFAGENKFTLDAEAPALYFALLVETGDSLSISIDSAGQLDSVMQVIGPDGSEFAYDDDGGSGFDAELSNLIFDRGGTYILSVTSVSGAASGSGRLTVARNPVQALEDGAALIELNDKTIRDLVVFDAEAEETLILHLDKIAGDVEDLFVTATVEGMEVMSYSTMGVPEELPLAFVMPMSGRVVVALEKFGHNDGISLSVSLERP